MTLSEYQLEEKRIRKIIAKIPKDAVYCGNYHIQKCKKCGGIHFGDDMDVTGLGVWNCKKCGKSMTSNQPCPECKMENK